MHIQLVTSPLAGLSDAALPGLRSKVWLAHPDTGTTAMDAYRAGDLFATAVRDNPGFAAVRTRDFAVLDGPTKVTRAELLRSGSDGARTRDLGRDR